MNKLTDKRKIDSMRNFYVADHSARVFLDSVSEQFDNHAETSKEHASNLLKVTEDEIWRLFKEFERIGLGRIIEGRRGHKTRFAWDYSLTSISIAARDQTPSAITPAPDDKMNGSDASATGATLAGSSVVHTFRLRVDLSISISLPLDLKSVEADRIAAWIKTLPIQH